MCDVVQPVFFFRKKRIRAEGFFGVAGRCGCGFLKIRMFLGLFSVVAAFSRFEPCREPIQPLSSKRNLKRSKYSPPVVKNGGGALRERERERECVCERERERERERTAL